MIEVILALPRKVVDRVGLSGENCKVTYIYICERATTEDSSEWEKKRERERKWKKGSEGEKVVESIEALSLSHTLSLMQYWSEIRRCLFSFGNEILSLSEIHSSPNVRTFSNIIMMMIHKEVVKWTSLEKCQVSAKAEKQGQKLGLSNIRGKMETFQSTSDKGEEKNSTDRSIDG